MWTPAFDDDHVQPIEQILCTRIDAGGSVTDPIEGHRLPEEGALSYALFVPEGDLRGPRHGWRLCILLNYTPDMGNPPDPVGYDSKNGTWDDTLCPPAAYSEDPNGRIFLASIPNNPAARAALAQRLQGKNFKLAVLQSTDFEEARAQNRVLGAGGAIDWTL